MERYGIKLYRPFNIIDRTASDAGFILALASYLRTEVPGFSQLSAVSRPNVRQCQYLNNRIEQDHRRIKRRIRSMLGFKSVTCAANMLSGIEIVYMVHKQQARYAFNPAPSLAEQFSILAA